MYLRYLRIIDRESDKLELKLRHSMQNREILMLLELSKTLVYFTTSLKSNEIVMEKLTTLARIKQYPEDEDLLEDVITENKQAIEMANIYSGVLANMTDAFASIDSDAHLLDVRHELRRRHDGHAVHRQTVGIPAHRGGLDGAGRGGDLVPDPLPLVQVTRGPSGQRTMPRLVSSYVAIIVDHE